MVTHQFTSLKLRKMNTTLQKESQQQDIIKVSNLNKKEKWIKLLTWYWERERDNVSNEPQISDKPYGRGNWELMIRNGSQQRTTTTTRTPTTRTANGVMNSANHLLTPKIFFPPSKAKSEYPKNATTAATPTASPTEIGTAPETVSSTAPGPVSWTGKSPLKPSLGNPSLPSDVPRLSSSLLFLTIHFSFKIGFANESKCFSIGRVKSGKARDKIPQNLGAQ